MDRNSIINLYKKGLKNAEIAKALRISRSTVWRTLKRFGERGEATDRPRSGRPRTSRTKKRIKAVAEKIRRCPKRSIRKMAKEHKISERTMRRLVKDYLKKKSLKIQKKQSLSEAQKIKRVNRSSLLLNELCHGMAGEVVWSDEKIFTVEMAHNRQNDRVICKSVLESPAGKHGFRSMKPASVIVWAAVSATWKSPLIFVDKNIKINFDVYISHILQPMSALMKKHFGDKKMDLPSFQQDGASSHTSLKSQKWLSENVPRFWDKAMWPPCSSDFNPMDFSVWSWLEKEACSIPHKSIGSLKNSLKRAWEKMPKSNLHAICDSVPKRIKLLLKK